MIPRISKILPINSTKIEKNINNQQNIIDKDEPSTVITTIENGIPYVSLIIICLFMLLIFTF